LDLDDIREAVLAWFERSMVRARSWSLSAFVETFVEHPLMVQLARRLVFAASTGEGMRCFRICEDGTFSDDADQSLELDSGVRIRLAHPFGWTGEQLGNWRQIFEDYRILQPFPQLYRSTHILTEDERRGCEFKRFEGRLVGFAKITKLLGAKGWLRDAKGLLKLVGDGQCVLVQALEPTLDLRKPVTLGAARYVKAVDRDIPLQFDQLDEVEASELVSDLEWVSAESAS
jgi:hypothetical protein